MEFLLPPIVEPRGNSFLFNSKQDIVLSSKLGLGPILSSICSMELINDKLFRYLNIQDLTKLCTCSHLLWTLITADEPLWKDLALSECSDSQLDSRLLKNFSNWKSVAVGLECQVNFRFGKVFSDTLHRNIHCSETKIDLNWLTRDNVIRETTDNLTVTEFIDKYESKRIPVVLNNFHKNFAKGISRWKNGISVQVMDSLKSATNGKFRCGARSISSRSFSEYTKSSLALKDESPLYIFDARFAENFPELQTDYITPSFFSGEGRDLFELLGKENRPDYRWVIAGAERSGSKWHVDPNCTHAWNASLKGKKKWLMLPPWGEPPPGVFPSSDGGSVAQPVSLIEWFLDFYKIARKTRENELIEFIADVGQVVFVPSGWWHAVLNIEESFAVTQNYVSITNLYRTIKFFQEKPDQISGLRRRRKDDENLEERKNNFYKEFLLVLPENINSLYEKEKSIIESNEKNNKRVLWNNLVSTNTEKIKTFSFDFKV